MPVTIQTIVIAITHPRSYSQKVPKTIWAASGATSRTISTQERQFMSTPRPSHAVARVFLTRLRLKSPQQGLDRRALGQQLGLLGRLLLDDLGAAARLTKRLVARASPGPDASCLSISASVLRCRAASASLSIRSASGRMISTSGRNDDGAVGRIGRLGPDRQRRRRCQRPDERLALAERSRRPARRRSGSARSWRPSGRSARPGGSGCAVITSCQSPTTCSASASAQASG